MSKHQIAFFTFTLGRTQSIGPDRLADMWRRASGTRDSSVSRKTGHYGDDRPVYTLYAPQNLGDLRGVELRLRGLLEAAHLNASVKAMHP